VAPVVPKTLSCEGSRQLSCLFNVHGLHGGCALIRPKLSEAVRHGRRQTCCNACALMAGIRRASAERRTCQREAAWRRRTLAWNARWPKGVAALLSVRCCGQVPG